MCKENCETPVGKMASCCLGFLSPHSTLLLRILSLDWNLLRWWWYFSEAGGPPRNPLRCSCLFSQLHAPVSVAMPTVPREKDGALPEAVKPMKVQHKLPNTELPIVDSMISISSGHIGIVSENCVLKMCGLKTLQEHRQHNTMAD